jgi:flavodoxin
MKTLVAYFSAESGRTRDVAGSLASAMGADLFEIRPEKPYTAADLNYINPLARCNREKFGKKKVPFAGDVENFESYDTVLIGFPIWYGGTPGVVNDFCQAHDFTGKKVAAFATSGGSGIGKTAVKLQPYVKGASVVDAKLFQSADPGPLKAWAQSL